MYLGGQSGKLIVRTQCGHGQMTRDRLSEEIIRQLQPPTKGNRVTYFAGATIQGAKAPRGFGIRITAAGARAFILNYQLRGLEYRYTIGAWPDWSALKAVRQARHLRQRVDRGENPLDDRASSSDAATVASVLDDFVVRYVRKKIIHYVAPTSTKAPSIGS